LQAVKLGHFAVRFTKSGGVGKGLRHGLASISGFTAGIPQPVNIKIPVVLAEFGFDFGPLRSAFFEDPVALVGENRGKRSTAGGDKFD
jgi:hypothetical protein